MQDKLNILLVDDEDSFRVPLERYLKSNLDCHIDAAATAVEAVRRAEEAQPPYDVVLIDELLILERGSEPEPISIELMGKIRKCSPQTEFIIFTGWGMDRALEALKAGAYRYLAKPLNLEELSVTIRMAADQSRLRAERDQLHEELQRQYEELKRAKGLVGARTALAWMGMVSSAWRHAVGNYATTIQDLVELARRDLESGLSIPKVENRLQRIDESARKIHAVPVSAPLSVETGLESVLINDFVSESVTRLWDRQPYKSIELRLSLMQDDEAMVKVSPEWLRRVLDILIDNAVEAMADSPTKRLTIETRSKETVVEIAVADTGEGIPKEVLSRLFEEPITSSQGSRGSGVGLLMAQTIVQTYGGELRVASTGTSGTTMVVRLPMDS